MRGGVRRGEATAEMLREAMGRLSAAETQTTVQTRQRLMAVLKVLIVGGDASLRATARPVLERQGFAVAVAETGATALRLDTAGPSMRRRRGDSASRTFPEAPR